MICRDQLEAVYRLIEDPARWTQGYTARDSEGAPVSPYGPASCWCVIGAFMHLKLASSWEVPTRILMGDKLADSIIACGSDGGIAKFNDTHTHSEVLALLKAAIERAPVRP